MNANIADILNECIDRLAQGETVEECLALYPAWAAELEPLLRTATVLHRAARITPDPLRKDAAKRQFLATTQRKTPARGRLVEFSRITRTLAACLAAALLLTMAMAGGIVASADSTPDDRLYSLKRATERVQLLLAGDESAASLHIELAGRRLNELEAVANRRGVVDDELLAEITAETDEAVAVLGKTGDKEKLGEQLLSLTIRQQEVLQKVAAKAPEQAKEGLEKAMERSRRGHEVASAAVSGRDDRENKEWKVSSATPTSPGKQPVAGGREADEEAAKKQHSPTATPTTGQTLATTTADAERENGAAKSTPRAATSTRTPRADEDDKLKEKSQPKSQVTPTWSPTPRASDTPRSISPTATPRSAVPAATVSPSEATSTPRPLQAASTPIKEVGED